ncbi:MAG: hypothetical protein RJS97_03955 [Parvibaculaceae bacterium]
MLRLWMMHNEDLSDVYDSFMRVFEGLTEEDTMHPDFDEGWRRLEAATLLAKGSMQWFQKASDELGKHDPYCHLVTIH